MWSSTHSSRRSHEQTHSESKHSRSSSPGESTESHRRTSSEATPRPTPAHPRFLTTTTDQDASKNAFLSSSPADVFASSSKRLGFLADKLSSSLSGTGNSQKNQTQLHVPHSHSRGDSSSTSISVTPSIAMASSSSISNVTKAHTSPSKASYGRTYDSKLVTREMHRLGNFPQFPTSLAPQMSSAPSVTSLALPPPGSMSQVNLASTATTDPWGTLHVHVLPLFNGEPLRIPIEDLNVLVKRHIQTVISSPARALVKLENDASELIASGMVTLNAKLMGVDDEKLVARVVETWGFFWDQILTYVEGVLLPLQTDPLLSSLSKTKPHHRATSPSGTNAGQSSKSSSQLSTGTPSIDVRTVALRSFRDRVVYPLYPRLLARLSLPNRQDVFQETTGYQQPRLQQMLLVLSAQSRQRPVALSLTAPAPQPTPGEAAITDLLQLVRNPHPQINGRKPPFNKNSTHARTPSFLSEGLPRDRRGRIAQKHSINGMSDPAFAFSSIDDEDYGEETPRIGPSSSGSFVVDIDREKERELLDSLRSPEPGIDNRASIGGWGLGGIHEDSMKATEEEEEDEPVDMDQAQAALEKYMAGMHAQPEARRR